MPRQLTRAVVLLSSFFALAIFATAQQAKLVPAGPAELQSIKGKLDLKLLPENAKNLEVENKQVFNLVSENTTQLTVVPVRFEIPIDTIMGKGAGTATDCGIYLIPSGGAGSFLLTIGQEEELSGAVQCTGIKAVGSQTITESNPALIFVYEAHTVHESFSQAYVLSWDKGTKAYQIDEDWDRRIAEQSKVPTIRGIKQLMSQPK